MKRLDIIRWTLVPAVLLLMLGGLVGCSSDDPVTPHDESDLTAEDVAHQAGFIAYAVAEVLQDFNKAAPELQTMFAPLSGDYWRDAGMGSTRYYTDGDQMLTWIPEGFNVAIGIVFDMTVTDGPPKVAAGTGTLNANELAATFTATDVELDAGNEPVAGTMLVSSGGIAATVTFAPNTATVQIGTDNWTIDMTDGTLVE